MGTPEDTEGGRLTDPSTALDQLQYSVVMSLNYGIPSWKEAYETQEVTGGS